MLCAVYMLKLIQTLINVKNKEEIGSLVHYKTMNDKKHSDFTGTLKQIIYVSIIVWHLIGMFMVN
jgi:hypothetical protein